MIVNVPTKIIPIWFVEKWKKENAEPGSALDVFLERMIKDWELEEMRQSNHEVCGLPRRADVQEKCPMVDYRILGNFNR